MLAPTTSSDGGGLGDGFYDGIGKFENGDAGGSGGGLAGDGAALWGG